MQRRPGGSSTMALEAESTVLRLPFLAAAGGGGDGEVTDREAAAPVFLATEKGRPVDPMIWGDEKRMKRELLVWAKAVASMAASNNVSPYSSSPSSRSTRRRG